MSWIDILWPMIAAACLTLGLIYLGIWFKQRSRYALLAFAVLAVTVASLAAFEWLLMRATDVERYAAVMHWLHVPLFIGVVSIVAFLRSYFRAGNVWLAWAVCIGRLAGVVLNFVSGTSLNYLAITALHSVTILGDTVSVAEGVTNPLTRVAVLNNVLLLVFVVNVWLQVWRRGDEGQRRAAAFINGSLVFLIVVAAGSATLIHVGLIRIPFLISVPFLVVLASMGYELVSDVFRAAQLAGQLQASEARASLGEQRMDLAASAAGLALWEWDVARDDVWTTDHCRRLFGFAPDERIDLDAFLAKVHREDREQVRRAIAESLRTGSDYEREFRVTLPEGAVRWVASRGRVQINGAGAPALLRGVSLDITARRLADERFRAVVEAAPNAMLMVDRNGRIVLANAQTEKVFGYARSALEGAPIEMLIPERLHQAHPGHRRGYLVKAEARAMGAGRELFGRRRDGSEVPVEIGLNPIETSEGMFVLASVIDISERKRLELEAAGQRDELTHLSRVAMLGELSGSLAHELNQPLAAILSNAQAMQRYLARDPVPMDEVKEILADIVENDRRAGDVIRRLRVLLKKEEPQYHALDVNEIIQDVLRLMRSDLLNRKVAIDTRFAPGLPLVKGDRVQLQQVLLNLVINGCDAMDGGPGRRTLTLRTSPTGNGGVEIAVMDRGTGIPEADLERVFEPFVTTKAHGMGLGLAVCRTIVKGHSGRLWATNNPDHGATLHFMLPANGTK